VQAADDIEAVRIGGLMIVATYLTVGKSTADNILDSVVHALQQRIENANLTG
jgi:hypothetical protein